MKNKDIYVLRLWRDKHNVPTFSHSFSGGDMDFFEMGMFGKALAEDRVLGGREKDALARLFKSYLKNLKTVGTYIDYERTQ